MIDEAALYRELAFIFAEVFGREDIALSPSLSAADVSGWDSFRQVEIIIATELRFRMKFTSAEVDSMRSLGDLATIVAKRGTL